MIRILFFAQLREQLDCESLEWQIANPITITQLCAELAVANPSWCGYLKSDKTLCAVNQLMVKFDTFIKAGDEVAFFPPVTGG